MCDYNIYENSEHEFLNLASEIFGCTYDDVLFLPAYRENIFHRDLLTSCIIFLSLARAIINSRESAWIYRVIILSGMDIF